MAFTIIKAFTTKEASEAFGKMITDSMKSILILHQDDSLVVVKQMPNSDGYETFIRIGSVDDPMVYINLDSAEFQFPYNTDIGTHGFPGYLMGYMETKVELNGGKFPTGTYQITAEMRPELLAENRGSDLTNGTNNSINSI